MCGRCGVGRCEIAAERDWCAEYAEEVGRDLSFGNLFGAAVFARHDRPIDGHRCDVCKDGLRSAADVNVLCVENRRVEEHQPVRLAVRKRPEQDRVDDAEHGRGSADTESDGCSCGAREYGALA